MKFQFTMPQLLLSTALFAVAWGMLAFVGREFISPDSNDLTVPYLIMLIPGVVGGAIGALFGDAARGACYGFAFLFSSVLVMLVGVVIWLILAGFWR